MTLRNLIARLESIGQQYPELLDREAFLDYRELECTYPVDVDISILGPDVGFREREWEDLSSDDLRDAGFSEAFIESGDFVDCDEWQRYVVFYSAEAED